MNPHVINVSEVIEGAHFNRFHLQVVLLCALWVFFDGYDLQTVSFTAPHFVELLKIPKALLGAIFSTGLLGLTVGALVCGVLGDRFGPKRVFLGGGLLFGLATLLTATATQFSTLLVYRFVCGFALGGVTPLAIAITSDYMPRRIRPSVVMIMYTALPLGQIIGGLIFAYVHWFGWRTIFYLGAIFPWVFFPLLAKALPEALEYRVARGASRDWVVGILRRINPAVPNLSESAEFAIRDPAERSFPVVALFQEGRAWRTVVLWATFFASLVALYFFNTWLPTLLNGYGFSLSQAVLITNSLQIGGILGTFAIAAAAYWLGTFRTIALGFLCTAIAIAVLATGGQSFSFLFAAALVAGFFFVGTQGLLNAGSAIIYPVVIRSTGVGWALGVGRVGSIVGPAIAGLLVAAHWQGRQIILAAAVPVAVAALLAVVIGAMVRRSLPQALPNISLEGGAHGN